MKTDSIFLNLSRGHVVDLQSLEEVIKSKQIAGAAIDVYPEEPKENGVEFTHPLMQYPQVICTPHIGGSTVEAQENIAKHVAQKLCDYIKYGSTTGSINLPCIQLKRIQGKHRIIHIHRNVPGIMARISSFMAQNAVNISAQYLATNEFIGYVIMDIDDACDYSIISQLKNMEETIKVKVLY